MTPDVREEGLRHVAAVQATNRALLERALHMRAVGYFAQQKARLLTQTIFEIDRSKQELRDHSRALEADQATIQRQKSELEARTAALEEVQRSLEDRVQRRTLELEQANRALREEAVTRERAQLEREQLREKYLRAQKLELVGRLAGGAAHDFNNLLSVILGHAELARRKLDATPLASNMDAIIAACQRGAALTRQLLSFAGKQGRDGGAVDPALVIQDLARLLQRVLGEAVTLELQTQPSAGNVRADASELEQILLNLIVNARDAMPSGGTIVVSSNRVERPSDGPSPHGPCIALTVSDNGEGMSNEVLRHVFEPFFTTKPPGIGTGLGLATVEALVRDCEGTIEVESQPGIGSAFRLFLPIVNAPGEQRADPLDLSALPQGHESILVVEDEESVRLVLKGMLQTLGYRVLIAERASVALDLLSRERADLVIVDSVMPGASSEALEVEIARRWPAVRILLMSGYADRDRPRDGQGQTLPLVQKPIELAHLAHTLRSLLGAPSSSGQP